VPAAGLEGEDEGEDEEDEEGEGGEAGELQVSMMNSVWV